MKHFYFYFEFITYLSYESFQTKIKTLVKWVDNIQNSYCFKEVNDNRKIFLENQILDTDEHFVLIPSLL